MYLPSSWKMDDKNGFVLLLFCFTILFVYGNDDVNNKHLEEQAIYMKILKSRARRSASFMSSMQTDYANRAAKVMPEKRMENNLHTVKVEKQKESSSKKVMSKILNAGKKVLKGLKKSERGLKKVGGKAKSVCKKLFKKLCKGR